jgi:AraC-like DNA-binding protein
LPHNFTGSIERILESYLRDDELNLEVAAGLCNMSKRTLQRKLTENGTSYSEVLDRARFRAASRLLGNPSTSVTDIGHQLGYSDVAHFTRAFRRIAGVTPLAYRQQLDSL